MLTQINMAGPTSDELRLFWTYLQSRVDEALLALIPGGARAVFFGYPLCRNVGDLLIWFGTETWLRSRGIQVLGRRHAYDLRTPSLDNDVLVLVCGGGNFGDLYPIHQQMRERLVQAYPHNRIVFLPQTVHFQEPLGLKVSTQKLSSHNDLHIMVRDNASRDKLAAVCSGANIQLCPDMATALFPVEENLKISEPAHDSSGKLGLFRRDLERPKSGHGSVEQLCDWKGDWSDLLGPRNETLRLGVFVGMTLGQIVPSGFVARSWRTLSRWSIESCVRQFMAKDRIITSRLHGHILATLLGKPSVVLDNSYGKNWAYIRTWYEDCSWVYLAK